MLNKKKAVLFDLDGTLVDSMWVWSQIDIDYLGSYGLAVPKNLQRIVEGMGFTEVAVYFKERFSIPDTIEEIKKTWQEMAMDKYCHSVPLKPGVKQFLPFLKEKGIRMAVASSNDIALIEACLKANGIREYFDAVITACEVKKGNRLRMFIWRLPDVSTYVRKNALCLKILFRVFRPEKMRE